MTSITSYWASDLVEPSLSIGLIPSCKTNEGTCRYIISEGPTHEAELRSPSQARFNPDEPNLRLMQIDTPKHHPRALRLYLHGFG
jgi:hypothetical protein